MPARRAIATRWWLLVRIVDGQMIDLSRRDRAPAAPSATPLTTT
jgi:hypothetical protein